MSSPHHSTAVERLELVRMKGGGEQTLAEAGPRLGYSVAWGRKWWGRYRGGGEAALAPARRPAPGPLAVSSAAVAGAVLAYRRGHPRLGARRAVLALSGDPALAGERLPDWRTVHRAWVAAGLVAPRPPRDRPPAPARRPGGDPHAVWQIDHQDHLAVAGLGCPLVLQSVRAPAAGLTIGADLFWGPHGAHAVPEDEILDALRACFVRWGRPEALSVDGGVRFLGQPQRQFPSRLELLCAGLHIAVVPIRPGRPTDHGAVERLHGTLDGFLLGPTYAGLAPAQAALDEHVADLNERFPSRAGPCRGLPPLVAYPQARHSGRPYDPEREWDDFDLAAVDRLLAGWRWYRRVGPQTGQISFADRNVGVGKAWAGRTVRLRFDPTDRQVVIHELGTGEDQLGPEIRRFHCPAFDKAAILGVSRVAKLPATEK